MHLVSLATRPLLSLFFLISLSHLSLAEHQTFGRKEGEAVSSFLLRTSLLSCAGKLGVLQPSKDYANFMLDGKRLPYVHLFHESGSYIVPLDGEKLKSGDYQALVSFPTNPGRKEKVLLTVSITDVEKLEGITVRTTIASVQDQNPNGLDSLNAISAIANGEDAKSSPTELHLISERFTPNLGNDIQNEAITVATKLPKIENIFNDIGFALDLQKAQEAATKAISSQTTEVQFEADLKKRYAEIYNRYDKEGRFKEETQRALDTLALEMKEMLGALKVCASVPEPTVSTIAKNLQEGVRISFEAHEALQLTFPQYVAGRLKGANAKKYTSIDGETLKRIHQSISNGILEKYSNARNLIQEGLTNKATAELSRHSTPTKASVGAPGTH